MPRILLWEMLRHIALLIAGTSVTYKILSAIYQSLNRLGLLDLKSACSLVKLPCHKDIGSAC